MRSNQMWHISIKELQAIWCQVFWQFAGKRCDNLLRTIAAIFSALFVAICCLVFWQFAAKYCSSLLPNILAIHCQVLGQFVAKYFCNFSQVFRKICCIVLWQFVAMYCWQFVASYFGNLLPSIVAICYQVLLTVSCSLCLRQLIEVVSEDCLSFHDGRSLYLYGANCSPFASISTCIRYH